MLKNIYNDHILRNSIYLMMTNISNTILGFFFWLIATRYYTPSDIGIISAILSAIFLISMASLIGLPNALTYYLPIYPRSANKIIDSCFIIGIIISIIFSLIFILEIDILAPELKSALSLELTFIFILTTIVITISSIMAATFTAGKRSSFQMIKENIFGFIKIFLLILLSSFGPIGILVSWNFGSIISIIIGFFLMFKLWGYIPTFRFDPIIKNMAGFSVGSYISGIFFSLPKFILPIMIVNMISTESAGYFFIAMTIAGMLYGISTSTTGPFLVESNDKERFWHNVNKVIKLNMSLLIPGLLLFTIFGRLVLNIFNPEYASNSLGPLIILSIASIPLSLVTVFCVVRNAQKRMMELIVTNGMTAIMTIILSIPLMRVWNIDGAAMAYLIANTIMAIVIIFRMKNPIEFALRLIKDDKQGETVKILTTTMRFIIILVLLTTINIPNVSAIDFSHPNMFLDNTEINVIKSRINTEPWKTAYDKFMTTDVPTAFNMSIQSVTFGRSISSSGVINDYWTDLPYSSDGVYNPNADRTDYIAAMKIRDSVRDLGLAYVLTEDSKYANKALELIRAWAISPQTKMNPKFTNEQSKVELSITMPGMFYGADLIWNYPGFSSADKAALKSWTTEFIKSAKRWEGTYDNNYELWRLVVVSSGSIITEDSASLLYAFDRWKTELPKQVDIEGKIIKELRRTRSFTYSLYGIDAFLNTAEIARHQGVDLYNYHASTGQSIELALDFHAPYASGDESWPYQEIRWDLVNYGLWEFAYSFKQKSSYMGVIVKRGRPMYEIRNIGPITLTHANAYFNLTAPSISSIPTIIPTIRPGSSPTITPRSGTTLYSRFRAIIRCYVRRVDGTIDNCY